MRYVKAVPAVLAIALAACGGAAEQPAADVASAPVATGTATAEHGDAAVVSTQSTTTTDASPMQDLNSFVPAGATLLDTIHGDLTGDGGKDDALLVVTPASPGDEPAGEGPARQVILLLGDGAGGFRKAAENTVMVPCAKCGGVAGDPYAYARIDSGFFMVAIGGGSRERWFDNYEFRYAADRDTWMLERVVRGVADTMSDASEQIEITGDELGDVAFGAFDPATVTRRPTLE